MKRNTSLGIAALCALIALAAGVVSSLGVFVRGDGSTLAAVSIRGERYEYALTGVYRYNAQRVVAEGVGWDLVTLFVVVPALLATAAFVARGSLRARLIAAGLLGYVFYQYLMYALVFALGPLFVAFIALYAASLFGVAWIAITLDRSELAARMSKRFPARGMAVFGVLVAVMLVVMWSERIAQGLAGEFQGLLYGQPTLVVQALDLGLIVPLSVVTGVAATRRNALGYFLSSLLVVKGFTMALAIEAMLLSAWSLEGRLEVVPFALFGAASLAALGLGVRVYASLGPERDAESSRLGRARMLEA